MKKAEKKTGPRGRQSMFKKDEVVRNIARSPYYGQLGVVVAADKYKSPNPNTNSHTRYLVMYGDRSVRSHPATDLDHVM